MWAVRPVRHVPYVFVADNMGWKKLLLTIGIFVVILAYFLYTPIPDGYSTMSACTMQLTLATLKTTNAVVGILTVINSL